MIPTVIRRRVPEPVKKILRPIRNKINEHIIYNFAPTEEFYQIAQTRPFDYNPEDNYDITTLICEKDLLMGLWALKSYLHYSQDRPNIVFHGDGSLDEKTEETLKHHFPKAQIVRKKDADPIMNEKLKEYPALHNYRFKNFHYFSIKLLDLTVFAKKESILLMDSDLLFFNNPVEIKERINQKQGFYNQDTFSAYPIPLKEISPFTDNGIQEKINAGLIHIPYSEIKLYETLEPYIKMMESRNYPVKGWMEQCGWAIILSNINAKVLPPNRYTVSNRKINRDSTVHHYTTPVRKRYFNEGIKRLVKQGFLDEIM